MNLVFFSTISHYPWGGADTLWTEAARRAQVRGDKILLIVNPLVAQHPAIVELTRKGAQLVTWHPTHLPPLWQRVTRRITRRTDETPILMAIRRHRPDRVFLNQGGPYDSILFPRLIDLLQTTSLSYHIIVNWQQENPWAKESATELMRRTLDEAAAIWFLSRRNLNITQRHLALDLPRAAVAQPPIRQPAAPLAAWPSTDSARLATLGRLEPVKGLPLLLNALADLPPDLPPWQLTIHGNGPEEDSLRRLARWLAISDRVQFAGFQPDLSAIWAQHHLLISPALDEGIPLTIPEAMLHGRPVLATRVGGAEEWITPGTNGYLCAPGSIPPLRDALADVLRDVANWPRLGADAQTKAQAALRPNDPTLLIS